MRFDLRSDLAAARAKACAQIDSDAEAARAKFLPTGTGQALVYAQKLQEAQAFVAEKAPIAGSGAASRWPLLTAEVGVTAADLSGVAQAVLAAAAVWTAAAAAIERARIAGKKAAAAGATPAAAAAAAKIVWPHP